MTRPTAAVIFDCDGVLVNSEEILQEVELTVLAEAGLTYDRQEYMDRFMGTSEAAWWEGLELDAVARLGRSIVNEVRGPLAERMRADLRARLAEIPGAAAAISRVRQPRAVASSSGNESLHLKLTMVGHWELFAPHIYSADDVGATKPAPDLFLHAAGKLGVDATECLVIEDSVNGILAAHAAGMRVWGFVGGGHHTHESGTRLLDAGAEGEVLPPDRRGQAAAQGGNRELGSHLRGDRPRAAAGRRRMTPPVGPWLARMRHLVRNLLRRPRVERDLDAELNAYRELLIEEKVAQGLRPDEAQRAARLEIGGADGVKEAVRDVRAGAWLDAIRRDVRVGVRALLRRPGFASIAIVTLAVGIGATTAIFSLIDSVLLRPLPFRDPDRLVMVWEVKPRFNAPRVEAAPLNYVDWQRQATSFEHLAAYVGQFAALTGDGEPERLDIVQATPNLLQLLGVEPALGRWFLAPEGAPGQAGVVVLSYGLWQRRYGADPGILGRSIRLDGEPHQVVGVMPRGFQFPRDGIDAWIPVDYAAGAGAQARATFFLLVVGRLKPAVTVTQANAELGAIAERLAATYPENVGSSAFAVPLQQDLVRGTRTSLLLLMAAALLVLLIACANVAGLLVTRGAERDREFAVRSALGAGRLQLARQLVLEGVILAAIGAALGLVLATQTFAVLERLIPATLRGAVAPALDLRLLGVTMAAVLLTGIAFGLVPLRHARKMDLRTPLNDRTTVAASGRRRMQAALVASEVALAVVVLFSAGLMIRTITNLLAVDPGFRVENALTARVGLSPADYPTTERQNTFYREVVERVTSLPGIVSAGFITFLPYTVPIGAAPLRVEGRPDPGNGTNITIVRAVTPEYFEALGLPLIKGRAFSDRDVTASQDVAIVSERAAALFEGEPVGQRVTFRGDDGLMTVVGVVGDVNGEGIEAPETRGIVYVPSTQMGAAGFFSPRSLVVRTASDPAAFVDAIRQQIWAVNPNETIDEVRTLESLVGAQAGNRRVQTWLFTAFGCLALFMAALGVYGLLSFVVTMRTRELGVRSAVGAQRRDLVKLIAGDSVLWVLCGLAGGLALSAIVSRRMSALIYGVEPLDLVSLAGAVGVLGVVATAAALRPVWRAARLDPAAVLRSE